MLVSSAPALQTQGTFIITTIIYGSITGSRTFHTTIVCTEATTDTTMVTTTEGITNA